APVNDVELDEWLPAGTDLVHSGLILGAPRIREGDPVERMTQRLEDSFRFAGDAVAPVHQGAEHVEEQCLDFGQWVCGRLRPCSRSSQKSRTANRERGTSLQQCAPIECCHRNLPWFFGRILVTGTYHMAENDCGPERPTTAALAFMHSAR